MPEPLHHTRRSASPGNSRGKALSFYSLHTLCIKRSRFDLPHTHTQPTTRIFSMKYDFHLLFCCDKYAQYPSSTSIYPSSQVREARTLEDKRMENFCCVHLSPMPTLPNAALTKLCRKLLYLWRIYCIITAVHPLSAAARSPPLFHHY